MRPCLFLMLVVLAACGDELDLAADLGPSDVSGTDMGTEPTDGPPPDAAALSGTYLLRLDAGAFPPTPAHPSALVYVPPGFDPTPPLSLIIYLHGFNNCVENIVRTKGESCDPQKGTPVRTAFSLAAQLDASKRNALLLCPEVAFDQSSPDPGNLAKTDGMKALLAEALAALPAPLSSRTPADVRDVVLASHSGGYQAAAAIATRGGLPIRELYLFDSLYGNTTEFDSWITSDLPSFSGATPLRRFADVYTSSGGTLARSQAMADRARAWVSADPTVLIDDRTTATWPAATYQHGLLFKLSELSHDGVARYYFEKLLTTSPLPPIR